VFRPLPVNVGTVGFWQPSHGTHRRFLLAWVMLPMLHMYVITALSHNGRALSHV